MGDLCGLKAEINYTDKQIKSAQNIKNVWYSPNGSLELKKIDSVGIIHSHHTVMTYNDITQHLKIVPSYIITSYLAGDYFQALRNIIVP